MKITMMSIGGGRSKVGGSRKKRDGDRKILEKGLVNQTMQVLARQQKAQAGHKKEVIVDILDDLGDEVQDGFLNLRSKRLIRSKLNGKIRKPKDDHQYEKMKLECPVIEEKEEDVVELDKEPSEWNLYTQIRNQTKAKSETTEFKNLL